MYHLQERTHQRSTIASLVGENTLWLRGHMPRLQSSKCQTDQPGWKLHTIKAVLHPALWGNCNNDGGFDKGTWTHVLLRPFRCFPRKKLKHFDCSLPRAIGLFLSHIDMQPLNDPFEQCKIDFNHQFTNCFWIIVMNFYGLRIENDENYFDIGSPEAGPIFEWNSFCNFEVLQMVSGRRYRYVVTDRLPYLKSIWCELSAILDHQSSIRTANKSQTTEI